jgi:hypothetical protein
MADQPLPHRVSRTAWERWGCLFAGIHLILKGWLERKWSTQVLVGLGVLGYGHLALGLRLTCLGCEQNPRPPWRHVVLGLPYLCAGQTRAYTWCLNWLALGANQTTCHMGLDKAQSPTSLYPATDPSPNSLGFGQQPQLVQVRTWTQIIPEPPWVRAQTQAPKPLGSGLDTKP